MSKRVYLDHGATTPMDKRVFEAMKPYFLNTFGNASSLHSFGREAREGLEKARESLAARIGANAQEFVFTSGGSESDNLAIKGAARILKKQEGKNHLITSAVEHHAVLETCEALAENEEFELSVLGVDAEGFVTPEQVASAIRKDTGLVSIMHANNEVGTVLDIAGIGKVCRENGVLFHTDAVQSLTKEKIDVVKQNVDLASFSAHKIHGPNGIGGLFVREGVSIEKQIHGGHQEFDMRAGTENVVGAVGFAAAAELIGDKEVAHMKVLRDRAIKSIENKIDEVKLNGSRKKRLCNNVNFSFKYIEGEAMMLHLDIAGIAVSTGSACSSKSLEMSHVLKAIGVEPELGNGTLRITVGHENTEKEIDYAVDKLEETVSKLREMSPLKKK